MFQRYIVLLSMGFSTEEENVFPAKSVVLFKNGYALELSHKPQMIIVGPSEEAGGHAAAKSKEIHAVSLCKLENEAKTRMLFQGKCSVLFQKNMFVRLFLHISTENRETIRMDWLSRRRQSRRTNRNHKVNRKESCAAQKIKSKP